MIKKLPAYFSFLLFVSLLTLFVLELIGKSDILTVSISKYLDFLMQGPLLVVFAVFVFVGLGATRIVIFGLFRNVASVEKKITSRLFFLLFSFVLVAQLVGTFLLRANKIGTP